MILITGSMGLIGRAITAQLETLHFETHGFDIKHTSNNSNYGDITNPIEKLVNLNHVEGIIHLAAISRVIHGEQNPALCWLTNVMGTYQLLQSLSTSKNKPWFIYASSREVYGQQTILPVKETAALAPLNHYAHSKLCAENIVNNFKGRGLRTLILRFSSVYGSHQDHADRVVPAFCRAALSNSPLRIDGKENILDLTHVNDIAKGIANAVYALKENKKLPNAIHLTSGIPTTLLSLAKQISKLCHSTSDCISANSRSYDVSQFYGDPSLAKSVLGWQAQIPLQVGLKNLLNDIRSNLHGKEKCES